MDLANLYNYLIYARMLMLWVYAILYFSWVRKLVISVKCLVKTIKSRSIYNCALVSIKGFLGPDLHGAEWHEATELCTTSLNHIKTSQGCENLVPEPSPATSGGPQFALRGLLPKGLVVAGFVWLNNSSEPRWGPYKPTNGSVAGTRICVRDVWCRNTGILQRKSSKIGWIRSFMSSWFKKIETRKYRRKGGWIVTYTWISMKSSS